MEIERFVWLLAGELIRLGPAAARIGALVAVAPGFSLGYVPPRVRVLLALAAAVLIAPLAGNVEIPQSPGAYALLVGREVAVGIVLGLLAAVAVEAARYGAQIADLQMGLRAAELFDPASGQRTSILGQLYYLAAVVSFFNLRGHHVVIAGLVRSFAAVPVGGALPAGGIAEAMVRVVAAGFVVGLSIAAPVLGALFITDVAFGIVARMVPRMNIFFVSLPLKMLVGLVAVAVSAPALAVMVSRLVALAGEAMGAFNAAGF